MHNERWPLVFGVVCGVLCVVAAFRVLRLVEILYIVYCGAYTIYCACAMCQILDYWLLEKGHWQLAAPSLHSAYSGIVAP